METVAREPERQEIETDFQKQHRSVDDETELANRAQCTTYTRYDSQDADEYRFIRAYDNANDRKSWENYE